MAEQTTHWHTRIQHWANVTPPYRPHPDSIAKQVELVGSDSQAVMVLGVTPELTAAFNNVVAVDNTQVMIDAFWPGDTETKRVINTDWFNTLDFTPTGIVGDLSLNLLFFPGHIKFLLQKLYDQMAPGATFACRVVARADKTITEQELIDLTETMSWHAWRLLFVQHIAGMEGASVFNFRKYTRFQELFPDRATLCARTGWDIHEVARSMDSYCGAPGCSANPTRRQWQEQIPKDAEAVQMIDVGDYELAELCPILTFRKPV